MRGKVRRYRKGLLIVFPKKADRLRGRYIATVSEGGDEILLTPLDGVAVKVARLTYIPQSLEHVFRGVEEVEAEMLPGGALLLKLKRGSRQR